MKKQMKTTVKYNRSGFALLTVIAFMALISAVLLVFTACSRSIQSQANTAYASACRRNLCASALAYTQMHLNKKNLSGTFTPDPNELGVPKAKVTISTSSKDTEPMINIKTTFRAYGHEYSNQFPVKSIDLR